MRTQHARVQKSVALSAMIGVLLLSAGSQAHAAAGELDPTFGQGGRVLTSIATPSTYFYPTTESVRVQPDGKVLVAGRFWVDGFDNYSGTFMARYLRDGSLDPSFGDNGSVVVAGSGRTVGADMALQRDGKIVLVGKETLAGGAILVQRFTRSGLPDTTFGDDGTAVVSGSDLPDTDPDGSVVTTGMGGTSIAVQPDGKIVGVGWEFALTRPYYDAIVVFRLNEDGSVDDTFGSTGPGFSTITHGWDGAQVLLQPGGKILVAGRLSNFSLGIRHTALLARYNADGSLDPSFGVSGTVTHRIHDLDSWYSGAALQPDGKIVAVGSTSTSTCGSFFARYDRDGSPDLGFGTNGVLCVDASFFKDPGPVMPLPGGRILATGNVFDPASGGNAFAMVLLTASGSLDASFGVGGRSVVPIADEAGTSYAFASGGTIQHDGRILIAGYFFGHDTIAVMRADGHRRSSPFEPHEERTLGVPTLRQPEGRIRP